MPVVIPEQRAPRVETAPAPRQSVFAQLATSFRPSQGAVNLIWVLGALGLTGGGAYAMNRGPVHDDVRVATLEAKLEAQKGEVNQLETRIRLNESRQKDFEAMVATAFGQSPCVSKKVGLRTELVCGVFEFEGFPAVRAKIENERMDPPTFTVELSDGTMPTAWPKP